MVFALTFHQVQCDLLYGPLELLPCESVDDVDHERPLAIGESFRKEPSEVPILDQCRKEFLAVNESGVHAIRRQMANPVRFEGFLLAFEDLGKK